MVMLKTNMDTILSSIVFLDPDAAVYNVPFFFLRELWTNYHSLVEITLFY